ncbi:hypothetical protein BJX61DRAFT_542049 [Aspergillus egyptiacus]|nr:hypothetical protein BJX61DRAFT_542049 [Aspergillus egyptiacus]
MGHFPGARLSYGPPPHYWGLQPRPGRPVPSFHGPPLRHFDEPPPAVFYELHGPEPRSPDHGYQECQDRLFLNEFRFPGSHQVYQPPRFEPGVHLESELRWKQENTSELEGKPLFQNNKLRPEAPEFFPNQKAAVDEEPKVKEKEAWFVVSSA